MQMRFASCRNRLTFSSVIVWLVFASVLPGISSGQRSPRFSTYYVSATHGNDGNPGSQSRPFQSIRKAMEKMNSGDTCILLPGLYVRERIEFGPPGQSFGRPTVFRAEKNSLVIITGRGGFQPRIGLNNFVRLENCWIGGKHHGPQPGKKVGLKGGVVAFGREGVQIVGCTFFGEAMQVLSGNTARNCLLQDNRFVLMGHGWFGHPLYLAGGPEPTSRDIRVIGNTFVGGMGFAIHAWHRPRNLTIVANFTVGHSCSLVAQGPGHVIHHNVFWKPQGKTTGAVPQPSWKFCAVLPNDVLRFDHNLCWSTYPVREEGESQADPVQNYTMPGYGGSQMDLEEVSADQLKTTISWFPRSSEEIDSAAATVLAFFRTFEPLKNPSPQIAELEAAFSTLKVQYTPTAEDLKSRPVPTDG